MRRELDNEKISVSNVLQVLKKIFIDNFENEVEIPGLDQIVPMNTEEEEILEKLKRDTTAREKRSTLKRDFEAKYSSKLNKSIHRDIVLNKDNSSKDNKYKEIQR